MGDLALYLTMAVIGYFAGGKLRKEKALICWTGRLQTAAMIVLIFTMGMRMGANPQVIENLNSIGLYAFIITIFTIIFSIVFITMLRKLMGIDRKGRLQTAAMTAPSSAVFAETEEVCAEKTEKGERRLSTMTLLIVVCVAAGLAFGHFAAGSLFPDMEWFSALTGKLINAGLCVLLFFVGFDMGVDGAVIQHFRQVGFRVAAFPFAIMTGTLFGAGLCSFFLPDFSVGEALAVGAGFGWYSFAPGIILEAGLVTASAVSFMHNVMRELISVLVIPLIAKKVGYLEAVAVPACSSMDVCLPIIERWTGSDIAVYSFLCGVVESAAVPVVVPVILNWL